MFILLSLLIFFTSAQTVEFTSPNGLTETCTILKKMPSSEALYSQKDLELEEKYCSLDFYSTELALCPKTWSTSPATMVYDISKNDLQQSEYEETLCRKKAGHKKHAKFKQTMNRPNTSGTFSNSSLLYYHFSRYFNFDTYAPVSVLRTMDKDEHLKRVSSKGVLFTQNYRSSSRIKNGWIHLKNAEVDPSTYAPTRELFTEDHNFIYGVLLRGKGERYGAEFNGVRGGWGRQDSLDFQKNYPFLALKQNVPLKEALKIGKDEGAKNPEMTKSSGDVSDIQMLYWMKELTEITLLDYIFNQQDRIGNIDYIWYWQWDEGGKIQRRKVDEDHLKDLSRVKMDKIPTPEDLTSSNAVLLQRTQLNDNDAGGKVTYANFTKKTQMLEGIKHYNLNLYKKLLQLNHDLQSEGHIYQYLEQNFLLSARQLKSIVKNVDSATQILQKTCLSGQLRFDLEPEEYFLGKSTLEKKAKCVL